MLLLTVQDYVNFHFTFEYYLFVLYLINDATSTYYFHLSGLFHLFSFLFLFFLLILHSCGVPCACVNIYYLLLYLQKVLCNFFKYTAVLDLLNITEVIQPEGGSSVRITGFGCCLP